MAGGRLADDNRADQLPWRIGERAAGELLRRGLSGRLQLFLAGDDGACRGRGLGPGRLVGPAAVGRRQPDPAGRGRFAAACNPGLPGGGQNRHSGRHAKHRGEGQHSCEIAHSRHAANIQEDWWRGK